MTKVRGFRYTLQPVLLSRQWQLDALKADLGSVNQTLFEQRRQHGAIEQEMGAIEQEWRRKSAQSGTISVDGFSAVMGYLGALAQRRQAAQQAIIDTTTQRDGLIEQLVQAQRAVEAVEQHRDKQQEEHLKVQLSTEFKGADDHWSTLQSHAGQHEQ